MADDQDFTDLADLLARARSWTGEEADRVRVLRHQEALALASCHVRDARRVAALRRVLTELDAALAVHDRSVAEPTTPGPEWDSSPGFSEY